MNIPKNKFIEKYMQIMRLVKSKNGMHFKLQIGRKKASILIHDMDRDSVILAEEYNENDTEKTMKKLKEDLLVLTKRLGKVNQKMRDMLVEYMNLYSIMAHIIRQDDLEIVFASIQHTRQQTSIAILDKNNPNDASMMFIDEWQEESLKELYGTCKTLKENYQKMIEEADTDDKMDIATLDTLSPWA